MPIDKRKPKVFVANRSAHDYSAAQRYGDLVFVTTGPQKRFAANNHARVWMAALKNSKPTDYIILSSMNIICGIGCGIFAAMHGKLNILMYRNRKYVQRELDIADLLEAENLEAEWVITKYETEGKDA